MKLYSPWAGPPLFRMVLLHKLQTTQIGVEKGFQELNSCINVPAGPCAMPLYKNRPLNTLPIKYIWHPVTPYKIMHVLNKWLGEQILPDKMQPSLGILH